MRKDSSMRWRSGTKSAGIWRALRDVSAQTRPALAVIAIAGCLVIGAGGAVAIAETVRTDELQEASRPSDMGVDITAQTMTIDQNAKQVTFVGNVDATRGRVRLLSDRLIVDYEEAEGGGRRAKHLDARGNVRIITGDQTINSDWARLDVGTDTATMGGGVTVTQGSTVLQGNQLAIDLATGRSEMSGGGVRGRFVPD